jgi:hypothetical protein
MCVVMCIVVASQIHFVGNLPLFMTANMIVSVLFLAPFTSHEAWDRVIVGTISTPCMSQGHYNCQSEK